MSQNSKFGLDSMIIKSIIIAVVTVLMLIPITMVESLIFDRAVLQKNVTEEISSKWGGEQTITGPVLVIPYTTYKPTTSSGKLEFGTMVEETEFAYFLPDVYNVDSKAAVEERSRSIYNTLVYQTENKISGTFAKPRLAELNIKEDHAKWDEAFIMVGLPYMQGVNNKVVMDINGRKLAATPGVPSNTMLKSGFTIKHPFTEEMVDEYKFEFDLDINGTEKLLVAPVGKENNICMSSTWKTVAFTGDFLPRKREVTEDGFKATWNIFDYNRNYVQMWKESNSGSLSEIGIELKYTVDQYKMSMRSVKYAIMFIALTFVVFFLVEVITKNRIHPIQYILVGFALLLFYTLLIALSEYISFRLAYLISSIAIVTMITLYVRTIFKKFIHCMLIGGLTAGLYTYLYIMLQMEDMSLLIGAIGLFVALAAIMYASRKVKWYKDEDLVQLSNQENSDSQYPPQQFPTQDME